MQPSATLPPPTFIDLNLLPEELRPRRYQAWYVLGLIAMLAAGLLLIPLNGVRQADSTETARLQAELRLLTEDLAQIQIDFGRARAIQEELRETEAAIAQLEEERQAALGDPQELSKDLPAVIQALPAGATVSSITGSHGQLTLTGQASSPTAALEYARALQSGDRFSTAQIASLAVAGGGQEGTTVAFTIEVAP